MEPYNFKLLSVKKEMHWQKCVKKVIKAELLFSLAPFIYDLWRNIHFRRKTNDNNEIEQSRKEFLQDMGQS